MKDGPHAVDIHVGKTIRIKRLMRKVSQTELGDRSASRSSRFKIRYSQPHLGEHGRNRRCSRCRRPNFFEDVNTANDNPTPSDEFVVSRDGVLLNAAFLSIKNEAVRKKIVKLVQAIAGMEQLDDAE